MSPRELAWAIVAIITIAPVYKFFPPRVFIVATRHEKETMLLRQCIQVRVQSWKKTLPFVRRKLMNRFTCHSISSYFGISCQFLFLSMNVKATRHPIKELWFVRNKVKSRYFVVTEQPLFTSVGRFLAACMESFLLPRILQSAVSWVI